MRFLVCCVATAALCIAGASPRLHATAACVRCHAPPVCMAKGDGKKSRPPKAPAPPPGPPMAPPEVAPRSGRITQGGAVSGSGNVLSVRQQIAIVRSFKKMAAAGPASPARRTSFRKIAKEGGERNTTKAVDEDVEVDLRDPLLFIDGYNVINMWPRLKKRFQKGELLEAREMLLADVADFTISRFESVVVFDANGAADRVEGKDREETYASGLVRVVYAHDSADAYIERETKTQRAEGRPVRVATSDNGIATACAMYGATVVSSQFMVTELKASRNAAAAILDEFNRRQWDASIQADVDKRLTKAQIAAKAAHEELLKSGALDRGAAARRKQLERQRLRRRPGAGGAGTGAADGDAARGTVDDEKPSSLFDVLDDGLFDA